MHPFQMQPQDHVFFSGRDFLSFLAAPALMTHWNLFQHCFVIFCDQSSLCTLWSMRMIVGVLCLRTAHSIWMSRKWLLSWLLTRRPQQCSTGRLPHVNYRCWLCKLWRHTQTVEQFCSTTLCIHDTVSQHIHNHMASYGYPMGCNSMLCKS